MWKITLTIKEQKINDIMIKLISGEIKTKDTIRLIKSSERQICHKKLNYNMYDIDKHFYLLGVVDKTTGTVTNYFFAE